MRLHFWRRKAVELGIAAGPLRRTEPESCAIATPEAVWRLEYHAPVHELCVGDDLRTRLFADGADAGVEIYSRAKGRLCAWAWELPQFPADCSTVRTHLRTALVRGGCDEARADHLAGHTVSELAHLVTDAAAQRDLRLAGLPAAADLEWKAYRTNHSRERETRWTGGTFVTGAHTIEVRLECDVSAVSWAQISAVLVSTRGTRVDRQEVAVAVDGLDCPAAAESLETWGWPRAVARSIGRAVAVRGRAEWLADMLSRGAASVILQDDVPTKVCVATGCSGTMSLHDPLDASPAPTRRPGNGVRDLDSRVLQL